MKAPEEKLLIDGPAGKIEVIMERPDAPKGIALIAHPHPLGGGANTNKVAYTLARCFVSLGYAAFRPNFRGVGGTDGVHDEGRGETDDLLAVIEAGTEALEADPFSPQVLNFLSFAQAQRGDTAQAAAYRDKMNLVLATIESSGDGLTEETPWHILMYAHAFDLLAAKNIPVRESSIISRTVEYIPRVKKDEKGVKGYYFDYGRIYWKKPEQGYKRERSWQFNNLKPWKSDKK